MTTKFSLLAILLTAPAPLYAQPNFNSGSTGADGALNITGSVGTVVTFDPKSFTTYFQERVGTRPRPAR